MADRSRLMWSTIYWLCLLGCSKLSKGCSNCWALHETQKRAKTSDLYKGLVISSSVGPQWTGEIRLVESRLEDPLKWKTPQVAWLTSMSDLYHEKLAANDIARILAVMVKDQRHTYQVLTKRVERARELLTSKEFVELVEHHAGKRVPQWPLDNCWLGTSVEDQKTVWRLKVLADTPTRSKFISFQPLLEAVDPGTLVKKVNPVWAIIGGEAGLRCREYKMKWGLDLHNQLRNEGIRSQVVCYPYGL